MVNWRVFLQRLHESQPCPSCGYEISYKQKRKIPISRFSKYECPQCKQFLFLKGGGILLIYIIIWIVITFLCGAVIFHNYYLARRLSGLFCIILACEGVRHFIIPFLPIKVL